MKRLRFWVVMLVIWLTFLFNIEQFVTLIASYITATTGGQPINILYSYTYIFILVITVFTLLLPKMRPVVLITAIVVFTTVYLLLTIFWHREGILTQIPFTVTQFAAFTVTLLLARQVNYAVKEFEEAVTEITLKNLGQMPDSFDYRQGAMYGEVKRARLYERPISMIAFKFDTANLRAGIPKLIEKIQRSMVKQFAIAHVAQTLENHTYDFDTIALYNDYFLVILPEADKTNVEAASDRLLQAVKDEVSITLKSGLASYPDDAITFEGLVASAMSRVDKAVVTTGNEITR